jgi:hypothetical protein
LRAEIARQRDLVLELDRFVESRRQALDRGVVDEDLRQALREQHQAAMTLARLINWHEELTSIRAMFGPEVGYVVARLKETPVA